MHHLRNIHVLNSSNNQGFKGPLHLEFDETGTSTVWCLVVRVTSGPQHGRAAETLTKMFGTQKHNHCFFYLGDAPQRGRSITQHIPGWYEFARARQALSRECQISLSLKKWALHFCFHSAISR
jgi:hypothetical protein